MDAATRSERAWLVKHIMERNHDPENPCPPVFALWQAAPAAYLSEGAADSAWRAILSATPHRGGAVARMAAANAILWREASHWLGLNEESIPELFMPELPHADWRSEADTPGYITRYAAGRMLDHYGATGSVIWGAPGDATDDALQQLCQTSGIIWAAWQPRPSEGWSPPGTERTAIVRFAPDAAVADWRYPLEQQFSDIVGCNVSLITPEQILEDHRARTLEQAEVVYAETR